MNINASSLRSRVARRIFLLFFLAAFVPILLISVISYKHINTQMTQQTQQQLHNEARFVGLSFLDRIITVDAILNTIDISTELFDSDRHELNEKYLKGFIQDINLVSPSGESLVLMGMQLPVPELNQAQRRHLAGGNSVVAMVEMDSRESMVVVTYPTNSISQIDGTKLLVAKPNPLYLYNFNVDAPQIACTLTQSGNIISCSSPVLEAELATIDTSADNRREFQDWNYLNTQYSLYIWDLFIAGNFQSEAISILVAIPDRNILSDLNSFNTIFPKTLLITGLFVIVLSISSIRKNFIPLEELMLGTQRIMNGDFKTPVKIGSRDEFASLAGSFNNMALRIDEQIQTMTMMSRIDRMILSSHDARQIIHVLIEYGHTAFPVTHIAVISIDAEDMSKASLMYNTDETFSDVKTEALVIDEQQFENLNLESSHMWLDDKDNLEILSDLKKTGDRYFLIMPLKVKTKITGMICLGNPLAFEVSEAKLDELRDLADRVAVALSNAAWEDKLYYQAHYDAVTGLPNRYLLKDRLDQAVSKTLRAGNNIAVLLIDLDQFKTVNDTLGHKVGDVLLFDVGQRLSSCVRGTDTLSRFGGDEFVILMDTEEDAQGIINHASQLARRIQEQLKTSFDINGRELFISSSIGIAVCPGNSQNVDDLLKQADSAMYHAKSEGRGQFRFFDQSLNTDLMTKLSLEGDLRHAIERNEFHLVYQPKVAADGGRIVGAEALLRWKHPQRGYISPIEFIPIAEESGLIIEIGTWVLHTACTQTKAWLEHGFEDFHISVNLSGVQFRQLGLEELLRQILVEARLSPEYLDIEITESVTIDDFERTSVLLKELHKLGVSISIDDFGTGYSSMSYLNQFEVDKIKIDKSFVDGIPEFESSQSIVQAIVALAHSLKFAVVAEGAEKLEQYAFLVNAGVDEIQGYYISRPLPQVEFERFYHEYESNLNSKNNTKANLN